jgi:diadenosine tetraphosphate (Ap4A) HIT family hydrolase
VPEPPRKGEPGGKPCDLCTEPERNLVWRDKSWAVHAGFEPIGLPMLALLSPVEHVTLHTMPPELLAGLGPMIQRIALAIGRIDGVGRVHFSRWGDGSQHFHMWFLARPLGMMQMRGPMLAVWDDLLPRLPEDEFAANLATVARALAESDG